jgi:S-methylmethionine-dependent homocysteine/selenocysteine methylase
MAKYRAHLPQQDGGLFLTDAGIETTLIFEGGFDLPSFAAFVLLREEGGRQGLRAYFERHIAIAKANGLGFILESPTWRASADWGQKLGYTKSAMARVNGAAIEMMASLRARHESARMPMVISGCVGPRGDGYDPGKVMSESEAETYHAEQIGVFADSEADLVTAITMTNVPEAIGVARAAKAAHMPVVISFTTETDGRLPTGQSLKTAVEAVDEVTGRAPAYYMINCAHPTHFESVLGAGEAWTARIGGLRANASKQSHAELDNAKDLDAGDPDKLASEYVALRRLLPRITVLGGCCGTDHRHIARIAQACVAAA